MVNRREVLQALPPVKAKRDVIADTQDTKDIIREVVEAHKFFASDYDKIADLFDEPDNSELFQSLFDFCKKNIRYRIETDALQTTTSPAALVGFGYGDCKHYAGFIGGILDSLQRRGRNVDWCYRFASYTMNPTPQHVFVVAKSNGREVWIDPVLSDLNMRSPQYLFKQDKKPNMLQRIYGTPTIMNRRVGLNVEQMALDVIKSYENGSHYMAKIYGNTKEILNNPPIKFLVDGEPYKLPFPAEMLRLANEQALKNQSTGYDQYLLSLAKSRGDFGKTLLPPQGLTVVYPTTWKGLPVRADMLRPVVTQDRGGVFVYDGAGTRIFFKGMNPSQTNQVLIANNNHLLDLLVCALGCIQMAFQPYPDATNMQRFYGNVLNYRDDNFLFAREIKTFAGQLIDGIKKGIESIGKAYIKFIGVIPRQAFLLLVKLNVANIAASLNRSILAGKTESIRQKWEGFGGDYGVLLSNINQGKGKPRIFGFNEIIVDDTIGGVGELTVAAALASAAPIIALLAEFLKSIGDPQTDAIIDSAVAGMNKILTAAGEDPIAVAQGAGGKPVTIPQTGGGSIIIPTDPTAHNKGFGTWIQENPVLAGAGALAIGYGVYKGSKRTRR